MASFPAQIITLSTDDYNRLKIYYKLSAAGNRVLCADTLKDRGTSLIGYISTGGAYYVQVRSVNAVDGGLSFNAADGTSANSTVLVPIKVIGYKL